MNARIVKDTAAEYHAVKALSNSGISKLLQAPAHFKAWRDGADKETEALIFGRMFHNLTLEPELFDAAYGVYDRPGNTTKGRAQAKAIREAGQHPVKAADFAAAQAMATSARSNPFMGRLLECAIHREISIYWEEEHEGIVFPCKARLDIISEVPDYGALVCDLKSAASAHPDDMPKAIFTYGYHRQAPWYMRACREVGVDALAFALLAVEKEPPYLTLAGTISEAAMCQGLAEIRSAVGTYVDCMRTNTWPGYPVEVQELDLPEWAYRKAV